MSPEPSENQKNDKTPTQAEVSSACTQISELLEKAREAQAKADNEALRAFQAKQSAEDHGTAIAKLKGTIEADAAAVAAKKQDIETISSTLANMRTSGESAVEALRDIRRTVDASSQHVAELSGKASTQQSSIEEAKKTVETILQSVREQTKSIEADLAAITSNKSISDNLLASLHKTAASISENHERSKTSLTSITTFENQSKRKAEEVSTLVEELKQAKSNAAAYENGLETLKQEFINLFKKVENLLPGATSAGLANTFSQQKKRFKTPQVSWILIFIFCMASLFFVAWMGKEDSQVDQTWGGILRHLALRVPFALPLIWLGIYSGRQYMLSQRMEEEYAFKEAISAAFEGYRREIANISPSALGHGTPTQILCANVLSLLSRRPGLIYEGKQEDVTPLTSLSGSLNKLAPQSGENVSGKP
jgi:predicted  nucleic acid-binding Zn-ribbon protein